MGKMNWFGEFVHPAMNYTAIGPIIRLFINLGRTRGWKNPRTSA
jgi:hypothetical protein